MSEEDEEEDECCICMESKSDKPQAVTNCNHSFCLKCFLKHTKKHNFCPYCREKIFNDEDYEELYPTREETNRISLFNNESLFQHSTNEQNNIANNIANNITNDTIDDLLNMLTNINYNPNNNTNNYNENNINLFGWHLNEINQINET